uniref:Uncharacterized protein n=1 Tax=Mucochytrium quahogii TaxID=96639 RepID=A0A7S2WT65_9STRA|mmetsp:Transcript_17230/g.27833  ORF Transcript_17230/g.27833 Transcript_17230/m.27833 type:complete len:227 (+) Transcript_17230:112-792(+)
MGDEDQGDVYEVETLHALCIDHICVNLMYFETHVLDLPVDLVGEVLLQAGSRVTPKLLGRIDGDSGDKAMRRMLDPYWERLCRARFKGLISEMEREEEGKKKSKTKRKSWRRKFRDMEKRSEEMLLRAEQRMEKRKREQDRKRQSKQLKVIDSRLAKVPRGATRTGWSTSSGSSSSGGLALFQRGSSSSSSTVFSTSRSPTKQSKMNRLMNATKKTRNVTRARMLK